MRLDMDLTKRHQAHQTGFVSFTFPPSADVTLHISWSRRSSLSLNLSHLQFLLHQLIQHSAFTQNRPWGEGLSALGAAVLTLLIFLIPAGTNAAHTVTVSTWNGDWNSQWIQTHRTAKWIVVFHKSFSHFPQLIPHRLYLTHTAANGAKFRFLGNAKFPPLC